ncbi:alpha/beta fold hydrolase [Deinococcus metallilatus]|uniref:Alpha/beta hydrolase n=1 Tax=Deinococcus metallilatus TaxID=1211322 RepID=A0AAJ5F954_9DEIO|nr:alpha/beta hydrolase [Deinococcus metallilatus]MBB5294102.1 pimeloyl-ACP methyl ester carboxylesterase [Deinococcus metallilatus]QBY08887.1 alpha/beta fold hydrolase [Deinococcus metallilatus]RXJ10031.1 alpha/beta fold hydrolase [Deinococcus metallilatus]TLK28032.1 alpha/beta hydrolase [Deinococcus metallilatus]GMA16562.1 alpha/beta hydrolase [Deinococcus metallilatus]
MSGQTHHFTRVGGLLTHACVRGEGPPLVLVPGLGCASWMYGRVSRQLARARTVYTYDPPGQGFSQGRPGFPRTIEDLTDHLAAWLEVTGLHPVPLLGHSLGGEVVFDLAARYPHLVSALIACAPTGIPENPHILAQLLRLALDAPRERPQLLLPALAAYLRCGPARMARLAQDQSHHATGPLLPHVRVPTLLLDGTRDPVIQAWTLEVICHAIPHATVREIPGGTHALTDSFPRTVARYTLDFLKEVVEGAS